MSDIPLLKEHVGLIFGTLFLTLISCYLPAIFGWFVERKKRTCASAKEHHDHHHHNHGNRAKKALSLANCLAAGVILGALLTHMIPHVLDDHHSHAHSHHSHDQLSNIHEHKHEHSHPVNEHSHPVHEHSHPVHDHDHHSTHEHKDTNHSCSHNHDLSTPNAHNHHHEEHGEEKHEYPFGMLAMGLSFLILLSIDKVWGHSYETVPEEATSKECASSESNIPMELVISKSSQISPNEVEAVICCEGIVKAECQEVCPNGKECEIENECRIDVDCHKECSTSSDSHDHDHEHDHSHHHHHHHHHHGSGGGCAMHSLGSNESLKNSKVKLFIFVLAMSLHSFLESLALGNVKSKGELTGFLCGLLPHKVLESFALGVSINSSPFGCKLRHAILTFFSLLTPIGISVGLLMQHLTDSNSTAASEGFQSRILNGLASGSFLFVSCVEMIPHELGSASSRKDMIMKMIFVALGFTIMAILAAFHEH